MKQPTYLDLYEVVRMPRPPHLKAAQYTPYYLAEFPKQAAYSVPAQAPGYLRWALVEVKP